MGNLYCIGEKDEAWKQQNKEMVENPAYKFANIAKGGSLIDAYNTGGPSRVVEIAEKEMSNFLYNKNGERYCITENEFGKWKMKSSQRVADQNEAEKIPEGNPNVEFQTDYHHKFTPHDACWDLQKRGGVGETPFHLLCLMDSPVHFEVAKILLKLYPNLALDVYEGEEYYGESALHIAIVIGDFELVQLLVEAGANVNQRATGRFFLPEDQKKSFTGQTDYEGYAYYGEYPLAFATCLGRMDLYDYLLDHGADPDLQDVFGNSVLHMVVISNQTDMYRYAVRHHRVRANTSIKNNENLTPLALACKLGRPSIFKEMLELDSIEFWSFSTTLCSAHPLHTLDSVGLDGSTNWNSALMIIVNGEKDDHLEMLDGGVMRQLLIEKWKTFAKRRFLIHLVFAVIHIILYSICVYTRPMGCALIGYRGPIDAVRYTSEVIVLINCLAKVLYEITEISTQGLNSFVKNCKHAPAQTVYLISCFLLLACIPFRFTCHYVVEDVLVILATPCVWSFMLFFARGYTLTGPFVTMIYKMIVGDLVRFGIIYLIFLSGFTQAFFFLFKDVTVDTDTDNPDLDKFATLPETVLKIFQMSFGEFKYDVFHLSHYSPLAKIIFALFMILVPILLLNMLIAMMGNTHTKIISKSTMEWWKQWAKIVVVLEKGVSKKKRLQYQKAYSVRLAGAPTPTDDSSSPQEQRALVVIRMCAKSRARKRKDALFRWKALSKEVIRQLRRKMHAGQPFHLKESLRKGQLLNEERPDLLLSSTINQLAWEKDIDLTKGYNLIPEKDNSSSNTPSHNSFGLYQAPLSATTNSLQQDHTLLSEDKSDAIIFAAYKNKKGKLLYNRVSPLNLDEIKKDELSISKLSSNYFSDTSKSDVSEFIYQNHQIAVKAECADKCESTLLTTQVCPVCGSIVRTHESQDRRRSLTSNKYKVSEMEKDLTKEAHKSKQWTNQKQVSTSDWLENLPVSHNKCCHGSHHEFCKINHCVKCELNHFEGCEVNHHEWYHSNKLNHCESCQVNHHEDCQSSHHESNKLNHHEVYQGIHLENCKYCHVPHHEICQLNHHEDYKHNNHETHNTNHHEDYKHNHGAYKTNHHEDYKHNNHESYNTNHHKSHNFSPEISSLPSSVSKSHSTDSYSMHKAHDMYTNFPVVTERPSDTTKHWFEYSSNTTFTRKRTRKKERKPKYSRKKEMKPSYSKREK